MTTHNHIHSRRLAKRLIISVVLFSTFITIITSAYQLYGNYQRDVQAIHARLKEIKEVHLVNIATKLWTADMRALRNHLNGLLNLPDIQFVEVTESTGDVISVGNNLETDVIGKQYPIYYEYRGKKRLIGQLKTKATLKNAYQHIMDQILDILVSNAIKTFLVTGFLLFLFYQLVTRHLQKLAGFAEQLTISNLNKTLLLDRKTTPAEKSDELDIVVNAFSTMQANLSQSIQNLQDSEAQVRLLLDSTAEAIFGIDTEGKCTFVNPACVRLLGYDSSSDLLGKNMHDLIHHSHEDGTTYPVAECQMNQAYLLETHNHIEDEVLWRYDNTCFACEYWSHPIYKNNVCVGAVVTFFDVSERRQTQNALRNSEEHYRSLIETTTAIPWELTLDKGAFTYVGPQAEELLGYAVEDWYTKDFWENHIIPEDRKEAVEFCRSMTTRGLDHQFEYRMFTSEGTIIWIRDYVKVILNDGKPARLTGFMFDVTDSKKVEQELAEYREHLEELVEKRTRELESSNKELESFSYSLAHDLRTPLRSITSFSQILKYEAGDKLDGMAADALTRVIKAAKTMSSLIDDILKLARVSRSTLEIEAVSFSELANKISQHFNNSTQSHSVTWKITDNLEVMADAGLTELLLNNLIENAYKFTINKEPAVIEVGSCILDNDTVYFVRDNGVGFDMKYIDKLFLPFERLHSPQEFLGTGIGLATVQRIVERHGGRVWAESALDKGTTFYFTFGQAAKIPTYPKLKVQ